MPRKKFQTFPERGLLLIKSNTCCTMPVFQYRSITIKLSWNYLRKSLCFFLGILMMISGQVVTPYDDHSVEDIVQTTHLLLCIILWLFISFFLSAESTVHTVSRHWPFGPRLPHQMDKTGTFKTAKEKTTFSHWWDNRQDVLTHPTTSYQMAIYTTSFIDHTRFIFSKIRVKYLL